MMFDACQSREGLLRVNALSYRVITIDRVCGRLTFRLAKYWNPTESTPVHKASKPTDQMFSEQPKEPYMFHVQNSLFFNALSRVNTHNKSKMAEELQDPNSVNGILDQWELNTIFCNFFIIFGNFRMMEITEELLDMNESLATLASDDADEESESEEEQEDVPMEVEPQDDIMFNDDIDR